MRSWKWRYRRARLALRRRGRQAEISSWQTPFRTTACIVDTSCVRSLARRLFVGPFSCPLTAARYETRMCRLAAVAAALSISCTTRFFGNAKVPNGVAGCRATCDGYGMDLIGMVAMGEYSDGCICQVRGKPGQAPSAAAVSAAVVGVIAQMAEEEQAANQQRPGASSHPGGPAHAPGQH